MIKARMIFIIAIVSTILCGCMSSEEENTFGLLEMEPLSESIASYDAVDNEETTSEFQTTDMENESESFLYSEESVQPESTSALENEQTEPEVPSTPEPFPQPENTSTFEYDLTNNTVTINETSYDVAANEMDYYGGYMFYYIGNNSMEQIVNSVNNSDLTNKYWREGFTVGLLEKAEESTLLESFVGSGGKIENYYILNSQEFLHSYYEAQMPIVVEYSIYGETYNTIVVLCMSTTTENEEVLYQITDIFLLDNLDNWGEDAS